MARQATNQKDQTKQQNKTGAIYNYKFINEQASAITLIRCIQTLKFLLKTYR